MNKFLVRLIMLLAVLGSCFAASTLGAQGDAAQSLHQQLLATLEGLTAKETIDIRVGTEKDQYEFGSPFELRFQTSQDCYVVLMDISMIDVKDDTSSATQTQLSNITFLLPNYRFIEQKIEGGRVYSTLTDFGLKITVAPPEGYETFNIFCSSQPLNLFPSDFAQEQFYVITPDNEKRLTALLAQLEALKNSDWSGNSVQIRLGPMTRGMRKFGTLPPIGSTGTTGKWFPPIGSTGTTGKTDEKKVSE
jgi:hypothetical protein